MFALIKKLISKFDNQIHNLTFAVHIEEILKYEIELLCSAVGNMLVLVSIFTIPLGLFWGINPFVVCSFSVYILLNSVAMNFLPKIRQFSSSQKLHLLSMLFVLILVATYKVYYFKLEILYWFIIVILVIFSNLSSQNTLFYYLTGFTITCFANLYFFSPNEIILVDRSYYISLFIMLALILTSSFIFNQLYRRIMREKIKEYQDIAEQNNEITSLYEEILASEEELKEQNEKLNYYNAEINANKERLEYLAYTDTLTGLPNRKMLIEQLHMIVDSSTNTNHSFSVVFIDLDNFKKINDTLGHSAGDSLLVQAADRLRALVHNTDLLGRLGGDELSLIIRKNLHGEELLNYVQSLCDSFDDPFDLEGVSTKISASFGIALYPKDARTVTELIKAADIAMYKSKELGKNNVQFYDKEMKQEILMKIELENRLVTAIEKNEFHLVYQPLFSSTTKKVIGFEALIRWQPEGCAMVPPLEFIPFAEETGIICEIGDWVLETVCKKIKYLENQLGNNVIKISINVSSIQLKQVNFVDRVLEIIKRYNVKPQCLEFEITESIFIEDKQVAVEIIKTLRSIGIHISLDDFGTGYSSLSYLMQLPINKLKIDKSFIDVIETDSSKNKIVSSIIDMVHSLDMEVVAEGVETETQLAYLEQQDCDVLQGYLLGKPLKEDLMPEFLEEHYTSY